MKRKVELVLSMMAVVAAFLIIGIISGALFSGCGLVNVKAPTLTPDATYDQAQKLFNQNLRIYLDTYKTADDATKARWKRDIDPIAENANIALDTWYKVLKAPDAYEKQQAFIEIYNQFINLLVNSGVVQIK